MKKVALLSLLGIQLLYGSYPSVETPPKLEAFIKENIGLENFFDGKNINANEISVKKIKDFTYFSFYIYKSVSMTTGIYFDKNNKTHHLRLKKQKYLLTVLLQDEDNKDTGLKNSTVTFLFTRN